MSISGRTRHRKKKGASTTVSIVAHTHPFVIGADTHARKHVYAILTAHTGEVIDTRNFPTTGRYQPHNQLGGPPD